MGNTSSTDAPKAPIQHGCHILHVQAGSPGEACGLKAYFDLVLSAQGIYLDKEKDEGKLVDILKANLHKPVRLMIYNLKTESLREAAITPSDDWGGAGVAGITIRYCSSESALDTVWHVLEVQPNSPASKAGLKPAEDYIIGTHNALLQDAEDLYNMIAAYEGKNLALFVYNTNSDNTRLVNLIPDKHWGGQGSIGCTFGSGYLHRIPRTSQAMASSDAHRHGSHSHAHGGHDHSHSHSHGHSHDHDDHSHSHAHDDHSHSHAHHEQAPHKEVHKEYEKEHKLTAHTEEKHKNKHFDEHQVSCDDHSHSHDHDDHSHSHSHDDHSHAHDDHSHSHAHDSHTHVHDDHSHSHSHDHSHSHAHDDHSHSHSDNKEPQRVHSIEELLSPRTPPPVYEEVSIHASGSSTPSVKKRVTPPQSPDISFVQSSFENMSMLSPIDHPEFQPQPIPPFSPIFAQPPSETEQLPEVSLQEIQLDENE